MKKPLKQLSIFFILIFLVVTLGFAYSKNGDGSFDNLAFLTQDPYQIFPNVPSLFSICIDIDVITSCILILSITTRAPPV